jgi:hypothetical protein
MRFKNFLLESNEQNRTLVIVDIQPAYKKHIHFRIDSFTKFIQESNYKNYLYLYNGPELGFESEQDIKEWLIETSGYDEEFIEKLEDINFFEKGYNFFRNSMDRGDSDEETISIIKLMLKKKVNDSRDLDEEDWEDLEVEDLGEDSINIPDVLEELKKYNNIDICGGDKNECLKEVELCLDVLGKTYNRISKFIF